MAVPFLDAMADAAPALLPTLAGASLPWLEQRRRSALAALLRDGLPDRRDEDWKYIALRALEQRRYLAGDSEASTREVDASACALPEHHGPRLVFVNGVFRADLSALDALPDGLQLLPLSQALRNNPEPLRFALARRDEVRSDAFVRLNEAFADDGVMLHVAAGVRIEAPVHVVHLGVPAAAALAWHARNVIELGEGASLTLLERFAAAGDHAHLGTVVTDALLRPHASLDWLMLQDAAPGAVLIRRNAVMLDTGSSARMHGLELGGALARHEFQAELRGDGACLETRGVFMPDARRHVDTLLDIRHAARDTTSDALWRGVADQRGRGVFGGRIVVEAGADGTDANLANKNLLLSPDAEIDTRPVLEIFADEVKAAHGATVGQLDERALFYLRSRGISLVDARRMLTTAFCRVVLDSIRDEALRRHAGELLALRSRNA